MPVQPGGIEDVVRDLQLTEPVLLLRAAAIDEAAQDLLAEATAKVGRQTPSQKPARPIRAGSQVVVPKLRQRHKDRRFTVSRSQPSEIAADLRILHFSPRGNRVLSV